MGYLAAACQPRQVGVCGKDQVAVLLVVLCQELDPTPALAPWGGHVHLVDPTGNWGHQCAPPPLQARPDGLVWRHCPHIGSLGQDLIEYYIVSYSYLTSGLRKHDKHNAESEIKNVPCHTPSWLGWTDP